MLFKGEPIKPHVGRLIAGTSPREGDVFLHQDISHLAGIDYPSSRYRLLITHWRRHLLTVGMDIDTVFAHGYRVLNNDEKVDVSIKHFKLKMLAVGKTAARAQRADAGKLDEVHLRQRDHFVRAATELVSTGRKMTSKISIVGNVVSLPRKAAED